MTDELELARRRYAKLRATAGVLIMATVLTFASLLFWMTFVTLEAVDQIERFTLCGSIPAQESVALHRENAERLNKLLSQHGQAPVPVMTAEPKPASCLEAP